MSNAPAYGLWSLVVINSLVFIIFAFSFTKPHSPRDWLSFGAFAAFICFPDSLCLRGLAVSLF